MELLFLRWKKKKNRIRELGIIGVCQTPSLSIEQACARNSGEFQEPFTLSQYLVHKRHKLSLSVRLQCVFQPKYVIWGSAPSNLVPCLVLLALQNRLYYYKVGCLKTVKRSAGPNVRTKKKKKFLPQRNCLILSGHILLSAHFESALRSIRRVWTQSKARSISGS